MVSLAVALGTSATVAYAGDAVAPEDPSKGGGGAGGGGSGDCVTGEPGKWEWGSLQETSGAKLFWPHYRVCFDDENAQRYGYKNRKTIRNNAGKIRDGFANCPTGWDVWYFWGTKENPRVGSTFTRMNFDGRTNIRCGMNDPWGYIFYTTPSSAFGDTTNYPYFEGAQSSAPTLDTKRAKAGEEDPYRSRCTPGSGCATKQFLPLNPLRQDGASCTTLAREPGSAGGLDLSSSTLQASLRNAVEQNVALLTATPYNMAYNVAYDIVLKEIGLRISGNSYVADGIPCSSMIDYIPANPKSVAYAGVCYAPTEAYMSYLTVAGATGGKDIVSDQADLSIRYSQRHKGYADSTIVPGLTDASGGTRGAWRQWIYDEVSSRSSNPAANNYMAYTPDFVKNDGTVYGSVAEAKKVPLDSRAKTAAWVANNATCRVNVLESSETTSGGNVDTTPPEVEISVDAPQLFQVGGKTRAATVTATAAVNAITCGGSLCDNRLTRLTSLNFDLKIASGGNRTYRQCRVGQKRDCDFQVTWGLGGSARKTARIEFYAPTKPGQNIAISVENPRATYERYDRDEAKRCFTQPSPVNPTASNSYCVTTNIVRRYVGEAQIRYTAPFTVPVIGAVTEPAVTSPIRPGGGQSASPRTAAVKSGTAAQLSTETSTAIDETLSTPLPAINVDQSGTVISDQPSGTKEQPYYECQAIIDNQGVIDFYQPFLSGSSWATFDPATLAKLRTAAETAVAQARNNIDIAKRALGARIGACVGL